MHTVIRLRPLLICLAIPLAGGFASAMLSGNQKEVYASLTLPAFAPPAALFGIVWAVLYLLMGVSSYLVWESTAISREERRSAITLYGLSLLANWLWSPLFFRFRLFTVAACWIVVVLIATALCAALFYRIRPWAGFLLLPTLAWLVYAGVLNIAIARLN